MLGFLSVMLSVIFYLDICINGDNFRWKGLIIGK